MTAVEALESCTLRITFGDGAIMTSDLEETINRIPALLPLKDKNLFCSVRVGEFGLSVE